MKSMFTALFIVLAAAQAQAATSQAAVAKELLGGAGRNAGLCVHLGCGRDGSADLTAELAANSGMLVHGLALDQQAFARANAEIDAKKVRGQAMVEHVAVPHLPYLSGMATLVVVEDAAALARLGLQRAELLRVVSPGGVLAVRENGKWATVTKRFPDDIDNWTHPGHDPGNTRASRDKRIRFPAGLAWQDGVPMNLVSWAAVRSVVVDGGRVFSLGTTELENNGPINGAPVKKHEYLTARDAFNGMVLWKHDLETENAGAALISVNTAPLVALDGRVYAYQKDRLVAFDGATGKVVAEYAVKHPTAKLLVLDGVLVAAGWGKKELAKEPEFAAGGGLWAPWTAPAKNGSIQAFDLTSGREIWSVDTAATDLLAADGRVYTLCREANPADTELVLGLEVKSGRELWRIASDALSKQPWMHLNAAGEGVVVVTRLRDKRLSILDGPTGRVLWEAGGGLKSLTPLVDGLLWIGNKKYDPKTGTVKGAFAGGLGDIMCTPPTILPDYILSSRAGRYTELTPVSTRPSTAAISSNRGACVEGLTPGAGLLFTAQNNCACSPGQMPGFTAFAAASAPSVEAFTAPRPVERGAAFGQVKNGAATAADWPMLRHNAERSAATPAKVPAKLKVAWTALAVAPRGGPLAAVWNARMRDCLTAPVVAGGRVVVAGCESGQIVALSAADGKELWRFQTGGRIDSPPSLRGNLCICGSHDGYVYALRASDGALAWRVRLAPQERRMISFGAVESAWPVIGSVILTDNAVFATAGRAATTDGGIAVAALAPETGAALWIKQIPPEANRQNDLLALRDGKLIMHHVEIDPATGAMKLADGGKGKGGSLEGLLDGTWARMAGRRSGHHRLNDLSADALAWTDAMVFGYSVRPKQYFAIAKDKTVLPATTATDKNAKLADNAFSYRKGEQAHTVCESLAASGDATLAMALRVVKNFAPPATGEVRLVSAATGENLSSLPLPAAPVFDSLAISDAAIYASLENGQVVKLDEAK